MDNDYQFHTSNVKCRKCFEIIKSRDFSAWEGLPDCCDLEHFRQNFELSSLHRGKGYLGRMNISTYFMAFKGMADFTLLRVWFAEDERLKMIEIELLSDLNVGKPESESRNPTNRMNYSFGGVFVKEGELVYNTRGISLLLNPDYDRIIKILLYPPVCFEKYQDELRFSDSNREFREDEG